MWGYTGQCCKLPLVIHKYFKIVRIKNVLQKNNQQIFRVFS